MPINSKYRFLGEKKSIAVSISLFVKGSYGGNLYLAENYLFHVQSYKGSLWLCVSLGGGSSTTAKQKSMN